MKISKILAGALIAATLTFSPVSAERSVSPSDSSGFVVLSEVAPKIIQEIRYFSTYNFVGDRIDGYERPVALMTIEAANALKAVSDEVELRGYRLKIFDSYRPQMAVNHFVRWAEDIDDTRMKEYFYPKVDKSRLFAEGYIAEHSGHSRGSTVDLTLFDMNTAARKLTWAARSIILVNFHIRITEANLPNNS